MPIIDTTGRVCRQVEWINKWTTFETSSSLPITCDESPRKEWVTWFPLGRTIISVTLLWSPNRLAWLLMLLRDILIFLIFLAIWRRNAIELKEEKT
ncbi:Uncharacterized protein TCM_019774 [Theobroma cacao]|uniref:Uncharacterized protein n=1 Tax=Theobroma cacao TaxID=3641 RepID=A0A061EIQ2_THECC|nr:Uncharacterized protein TCM_019774 [Theobroma cacao]